MKERNNVKCKKIGNIDDFEIIIECKVIMARELRIYIGICINARMHCVRRTAYCFWYGFTVYYYGCSEENTSL